MELARVSSSWKNYANALWYVSLYHESLCLLGITSSNTSEMCTTWDIASFLKAYTIWSVLVLAWIAMPETWNTKHTCQAVWHPTIHCVYRFQSPFHLFLWICSRLVHNTTGTTHTRCTIHREGSASQLLTQRLIIRPFWKGSRHKTEHARDTS